MITSKSIEWRDAYVQLNLEGKFLVSSIFGCNRMERDPKKLIDPEELLPGMKVSKGGVVIGTITRRATKEESKGQPRWKCMMIFEESGKEELVCFSGSFGALDFELPENKL